MPGRLLISDANVLIDMRVGGLAEAMLQLEVEYATPAELFEEELRDTHDVLVDMGLQLLELTPEAVERAQQLGRQYKGASHHDLTAMALAEQEKAPLLSGDRKLRQVCREQGIELHGTIWLVEHMLSAGVITVAEAEVAYERMEADGSRLPWNDVRHQLKRFSKS